MLTLSNLTWLDIGLAGIGAYLVKQVLTNPAPYPPGPRGWPLIGNISDMSHVKPWLTFTEWGKKYGRCLPLYRYYAFRRLAGDISHIEVLGQHIIVLNSSETAMEMLDNKGSMYSDRPVFPMAGDLVGAKDALTFLPYDDDRFRWHRKNLHRVIGTRTSMNIYNQVEEIGYHRFLKRVLVEPAELMKHIRQYGCSSNIGLTLTFYSTTGAVLLHISYGYEVKENNDPFIDLAERALDIFSKATAPGAWMVDIIPSCKAVAFRCVVSLMT